MNDMKELFSGNITDDNLRWLLTCTDAVHNLKTLKLTNCVGITIVSSSWIDVVREY